jgi:predicted RNA-binding Zn ribbon-like protein
METADGGPRELPIVGGDLALDFANTVDDPDGPARHDHLESYADLVAWARRVDAVPHAALQPLATLAERDASGARETLADAHKLRDALNNVFGSLALRPDTPVDTLTGWPVVRDAASLAMGSVSLARPHHAVLPFGWSWAFDADLRAPLHPVAVAATDLLVSPLLTRLKRCARCPWLFLDSSRNHSRRWCDMDDCGRAEKIERYVARRAARRASQR